MIITALVAKPIVSTTVKVVKYHGRSRQTFSVLTFSYFSTILGLIVVKDRAENIDRREFRTARIEVF